MTALALRHEAVSGDSVVLMARSLIGVRYQHQGRNEHGLDCIGLIGFVGLRLGFPSAIAWANDPLLKGYGKEPNRDMLEAGCNRHLVPVKTAAPGDVYLMAWEDRPRHFAILSQPGYVIHAYALSRKVCETPIDGKWREGVTWRSLIHSAWRYREVAE